MRTAKMLGFLEPIQGQFMNLLWILTEEKWSNQSQIGFVSQRMTAVHSPSFFELLAAILTIFSRRATPVSIAAC